MSMKNARRNVVVLPPYLTLPVKVVCITELSGVNYKNT
jgi:hypothetical protein